MKSTNSLHRSYAMAKFFTYFFLILGAVIMIFPFVWMILTSSKTVPESMQIPPTILPEQWTLANFRDVLKSLPFGHLYWNTTLMVIFRVICAILFSSMAGYAFAKLKFRGKNLLFGIVLVQMSQYGRTRSSSSPSTRWWPRWAWPTPSSPWCSRAW